MLRFVTILLLICLVLVSCFYWYQLPPKQLKEPAGVGSSGEPKSRNVAVLVDQSESEKGVLTVPGILEETNIRRKEHGVPPLQLHQTLQAAAEERARHMFAEGYFDHDSPAGDSFNLAIQMSGYESALSGENIALGNFADDQKLVTAWYESPGHKKNLLHQSFIDIGIAVKKGTYQGKETWISVQLFAVPLSFCEPIAESVKEEHQKKRRKQQLDLEALEEFRVLIDTHSPNTSETISLIKEFEERRLQYKLENEALQQMTEEVNAMAERFNECVSGLVSKYDQELPSESH